MTSVFGFSSSGLGKLLLCVWLALQAHASWAQAQSTDQCGQLVEAYKAGAAGYTPYLQFAADVARARDVRESANRYAQALQASSPGANALWLNNWCTQNPLKRVAEASHNLLNELTGQSSASAAAPLAPAAVVTPPPPQTTVVVVQPPAKPKPMASCSVDKTKSCAGCSVTCTKDWEKAACKVGLDSIPDGDRCTFQSSCTCW